MYSNYLTSFIILNIIGTHKQNFFESLHKLCLSYFNGLIQDGMNTLQMEAYITTGHPVLLKSKSSSLNENKIYFNFLHDIPDSMKYITEKLIELRTYLNFNKINQEDIFDHVDGMKKRKINTKTVKLFCTIFHFYLFNKLNIWFKVYLFCFLGWFGRDVDKWRHFYFTENAIFKSMKYIFLLLSFSFFWFPLTMSIACLALLN